MSYALSWIVPNRVILITLSGSDSDQEALEMDAEVIEMLKDGDPEAPAIHQILVFNDFTVRASLKTLSRLAAPGHPRCGTVVSVGEAKTPMLRATTGLVAQLTHMKREKRETVEEALRMLYRFDATLPPEYAPAVL